MIIIYTDGSTKRNGKENAEGGFGVIVCEGFFCDKPEDYKIIDSYAEYVIGTTNNRMELSAILWALEKYGKTAEPPIIYSDSMYSVNSFTKWVWGWRENGWTRPKNKPVENLDLMKRYTDLIEQGYRCDLQYVKGHNGNYFNELVDKLATGKISTEYLMEDDYGKTI